MGPFGFALQQFTKINKLVLHLPWRRVSVGKPDFQCQLANSSGLAATVTHGGIFRTPVDRLVCISAAVLALLL